MAKRLKIRSYHAGIALGAVLVLSGLSLSLQGYDASFLAVAGVAALGTTLIKRWRLGDEPEKDERTSKIRAFSLAYSWMVSLILATAIFSAINLGIVALDSLTALAATIYIMTGSAIVFIVIMQRRGDVPQP
ncbi:MAG: hypothetical protein QUS09_00940 [Methanotrichaceae archaeon]|nr:hypothetical protein [Methanotrichaceae archaeon]